MSVASQGNNAIGVGVYLLAAVVEQAPCALLITDLGGSIVYANAAFDGLTPYSAEEARGKGFRTVFGDECEDVVFAALRRAGETGEAWRGQIVHKSPDGALLRKGLTFFPLRDASGAVRHVAAYVRDIQADPAYDLQLRQSQKMEAIGQLASGIAHEINTPTQYIGDNVQFLRESFGGIVELLACYAELVDRVRLGADPSPLIDAIVEIQQRIDIEFLLAETPGAIERALEGNRRVAEVVRAMKEFAHPSAEEIAPVDINRAIANTVAVSRSEWKYVADLDLRLDPTMPAVPCLLGAFNQVILNLIVNAAHAIADKDRGQAPRKGIITITTAHGAGWAEVRIADTGTGIPERVRDRIFDPFFTTKEFGRGTGQGLAIARSVIVETHGGTIHFETEAGRGTTFVIRLPLRRGDPV